MSPPNSRPAIEWAISQKALPGQSVSGDLHLVAEHARGFLLAVVDGVGHGPEATRAAEIAVGKMQARPHDSVHSLINRCHIALQQTRGVVLTVVSLDTVDHTITWCGVGNVEGLLFRSDPAAQPSSETVLLRGGLVGAQLPVLYANVVPIDRGDLLVLASDGIRADFEQDVAVKSSPQRIADNILQKFFKGTDDALVLAVRYLGANHE